MAKFDPFRQNTPPNPQPGPPYPMPGYPPVGQYPPAPVPYSQPGYGPPAYPPQQPTYPQPQPGYASLMACPLRSQAFLRRSRNPVTIRPRRSRRTRSNLPFLSNKLRTRSHNPLLTVSPRPFRRTRTRRRHPLPWLMLRSPFRFPLLCRCSRSCRRQSLPICRCRLGLHRLPRRSPLSQ